MAKWLTALCAIALLGACSGGSADNGSPTTSSAADSISTAAPSTTEPPRGNAGPTAVPAEDDLKLNEIQVIGTHNSFHVAAPAEERSLLAQLSAEQAAQREYSHLPLGRQLDEQKIRQIELDIYLDKKGGLYADPVLRRQAGLGPYDVPEMAEAGIKVLHEQDVDYHSVCPTLISCLTEVKQWSDLNPEHVPIAINIQLKDGPLIFNVPGQAVPEKFEAPDMDLLDSEILSVFPADRIVTPDDVRGERPSLLDAVNADAWPTLGESRGKVMFLMINAEPYRSRYLEGHPNLSGRLLFTNAPPGEPDASYVSIDDPVGKSQQIRDLVGQHYLVRTRADEPDKQAKVNDPTARDAALASGAQWISTDYPGPDGAKVQYGNDYSVQLPGFVAARCNPVTASADCSQITNG